ncbi:transposase [Streptosporangium sp. NPDC087985]|uniref:transposase n=1 Tax=Streptosporangium sp. NPDC087985 TaxID=3366196 RepID=UPI0037F4E8EE
MQVLTEAIRQIPADSRAKILIRIDGAGATHELLDAIGALNTTRRTVRFLAGWKITDADEVAIAALPATAWEDALHQDGTVNSACQVAELTGLNTRTGWPRRMRLLVRHTRPSRRRLAKLTALEKKTGWRYVIIATDIGRMRGVVGSHHPQWLDTLARHHADVEDQVRVGKAMGLSNLPSADWTVNSGWVLAANLAADLTAWMCLLGLHDIDGLADAEPDTLRYRLWHLPAKLVRHARRRILKISATWPWREAFLTCWQRLTALPAPT